VNLIYLALADGARGSGRTHWTSHASDPTGWESNSDSYDVWEIAAETVNLGTNIGT